MNTKENLSCHSLGLIEPAQVRETGDLVVTLALATNLFKLLFWPLSSSNLGLKEIRWLVQGYKASPDKSCPKKLSLWTFNGNLLFLLMTNEILTFISSFKTKDPAPKLRHSWMKGPARIMSIHCHLQIRWTGAVHTHIPPQHLQVHARMFAVVWANLIQVPTGVSMLSWQLNLRTHSSITVMLWSRGIKAVPCSIKPLQGTPTTQHL